MVKPAKEGAAITDGFDSTTSPSEGNKVSEVGALALFDQLRAGELRGESKQTESIEKSSSADTLEVEDVVKEIIDQSSAYDEGQVEVHDGDQSAVGDEVKPLLDLARNEGDTDDESDHDAF
jgi:hypothetical protein